MPSALHAAVAMGTGHEEDNGPHVIHNENNNIENRSPGPCYVNASVFLFGLFPVDET